MSGVTPAELAARERQFCEAKKRVKVVAYATMKLRSLFRINKIQPVKLAKYAASASQNCTVPKRLASI